MTEITGETSDGFHTFNELYRHRLLLSAALWNAWYLLDGQDLGYVRQVCKSKLHSDGELPFGGGWFIVSAELEEIGQISYHYQLKDWDLFHCPEVERAPEFDGHTSEQVTQRLEAYLRGM